VHGAESPRMDPSVVRHVYLTRRKEFE
jgi:hypothetical protein